MQILSTTTDVHAALPRCAALFALVVMTTLVGCGDRFPMVEVNGIVTFDGGPPPDTGSVIFNPTTVAEGMPNRAGRADFSSDGRFVVTSFKEGDGLVPGEYVAEVICVSGPPKPGAKDPYGDVNYIAPEYEPETVVVDADDGSISLTLDVPSKKKPGSK